jgi:hypothetical protein
MRKLIMIGVEGNHACPPCKANGREREVVVNGLEEGGVVELVVTPLMGVENILRLGEGATPLDSRQWRKYFARKVPGLDPTRTTVEVVLG